MEMDSVFSVSNYLIGFYLLCVVSHSLQENRIKFNFHRNECKTNNFYESIQELSNESTNDNIYIGFLAGYKNTKMALGALRLGIEEVNKNPNLLPGKTLKALPINIGNHSTPWNVFSVKEILNLTLTKDVVAFIGPDETCSVEALLAAVYNIPMISFNCMEADVSDKNVFNTFARTLPPPSKVSKSVIALLKKFNWNKFVIVVSKHSPTTLKIATAIKIMADNNGIQVTDTQEFKSDYLPINIDEMCTIVNRTSNITRIYVFVGEHIALIDFLRCLKLNHLLDTGEYIVISVDDEVYNPQQRDNIMQRSYLDPYLKHDSLNMDSFRMLLKLTVSAPLTDDYEKILDDIKSYSAEQPFCVPYNSKILGKATMPIFASYIYDAVLIYARAATEVMRIKGEKYIRDGQELMKYIYNHSYRSLQGFDVYIDSNGDAENNYTVITMLNDSSVNKLNDNVTMSMQPVGYFVYNKNSTILEFQYLNASKPIAWLNGDVPRDEPICGFRDDLCTRDVEWFDFFQTIPGVLTILIPVLLFFVIIGTLIVKYYRYKQAFMEILWKIDMREVNIINTENLETTTKHKSTIQTCRNSLANGELLNSKRAYTTIGLYRGNIVAIKKINKRSIDLTKNIRIELKQMRELRHENIVPFIGAAVDNGNIAIFTTYCPRGSLENVLANEDLSLDQMFISSLVSDILKGLIYLHDSEIISHGNLNSSNCLVDSRWVCQITDFGLHEFKSFTEEAFNEELNYKKNLWRAPELLRNLNRPKRGSQKGDVYSFGIILYEITGRNGPWGHYSQKFCNKEIVEKVMFPSLKKIFRPPIDLLDHPEYVKSCLLACWDEEPDARPDVRQVRGKLKEMQAGLKPNIFDNIMAIMDKYAYNLEGLVQERTNQLCEEKKKTEALLLRMLPKTVAESLKRGERVEAECFDCVTIFFSDLVGFTELCAKSTPFEVVDMLNDLYTCCDSIISNYDVYKVETIGDAYMVVSGLPIRNGDKHVGEIASLALHLLERVSKLEIRHRKGELLQIRIGIHSGQCVAGVVGQKMPRYCLFGDTVNTASRMESTGEPLRIHISESTYKLLMKVGKFHCIERGVILVKGKGEMRTYWLVGEDGKIDNSIIPGSVPMVNAPPDLLNAHTVDSNGQLKMPQTHWYNEKQKCFSDQQILFKEFQQSNENVCLNCRLILPKTSFDDMVTNSTQGKGMVDYKLGTFELLPTSLTHSTTPRCSFCGNKKNFNSNALRSKQLNNLGYYKIPRSAPQIHIDPE